MKYEVKFPNNSIEKKFGKTLTKIPQINIQQEITKAVEKFADNPCPYGKKPFKQLNPHIKFYQFTAQYRIRRVDYIVLYDVDGKRKIVWILALRRRGKRTYK